MKLIRWKLNKKDKSALLILCISLLFLSVSIGNAFTLLGARWPSISTTLNYSSLPSAWKNVVYYSRRTWNNSGMNFYIFSNSVQLIR